MGVHVRRNTQEAGFVPSATQQQEEWDGTDTQNVKT